MKPTQSDTLAERRRRRDVDAKVGVDSNINTIRTLLQKLPMTPGASSPHAQYVHNALTEILRRINERSLEMEREVVEERRANAEREKRKAELKRKIAELERQLSVVHGQLDEIDDAPAVEATPNTRISLPPALPLTTDMLEPRGGKGAQLASCDQALFVADAERPKTPEVAVVDRPKTPELSPVKRRPAAIPRPSFDRTKIVLHRK